MMDDDLFDATCALGARCLQRDTQLPLIWVMEDSPEYGRRLLPGHPPCFDSVYGAGQWEGADPPTAWWLGGDGIEYGYCEN